jgi:hypothetical protein
MIAAHKLGALTMALLTCATVSAQDLTPAQILERRDEAMGGANCPRKVATLRMKVTEAAGDAAVDASIAVSFGPPERIRIDITANESTVVLGHDGASGWMIEPRLSPEPRKLDEGRAESLRQTLGEYLDAVCPVVDSAGTELLGKTDVKGSPAYVLRTNTTSAGSSTFYIDAATFLLVRRVDKKTIDGESVGIDRAFTDYRRIEGIMFPHDVQVQEGDRSTRLRWEKIEVNVPIDDDIFRVPGRNPQAIANLERDLEDPAKARSALVQLERALVKEIQNDFVKPSYAITDLFEYRRDPSVAVLRKAGDSEAPAAVFTITQVLGPGNKLETSTYEFKAESDHANLQVDLRTGFPMFPIEVGTVHRFEGSVILAGYTFENEGDTTHRLTFAIVEDVGYVYLRGKGKVRQKDGRELRF